MTGRPAFPRQDNFPAPAGVQAATLIDVLAGRPHCADSFPVGPPTAPACSPAPPGPVTLRLTNRATWRAIS